MLPSYFDVIFVHLTQKVRLRPELSPRFLSTLGPNPTRKVRLTNLIRTVIFQQKTVQKTFFHVFYAKEGSI